MQDTKECQVAALLEVLNIRRLSLTGLDPSEVRETMKLVLLRNRTSKEFKLPEYPLVTVQDLVIDKFGNERSSHLGLEVAMMLPVTSAKVESGLEAVPLK